MEPATWMTVADAAEKLGITRQGAHSLLRTGRLISAGTVGRMILVDPASVERLIAAGTRKGRIWEPATAWAALAILSGQEATWLSSPARSRLKKSLRAISTDEVYILARNKAATTRFRAVPEAVNQVGEYLIPSGAPAMQDRKEADRFGLAAGGRSAEGYILKGDTAPLVEWFGMVEDPQGNVTVHEVVDERAFRDDTTPAAAIAVDLMDSLTTRERSAGMSVLSALLRGLAR